ncbi:MAG: hypothetical protein JRN52_14570, partial [Nitrososphaerota archaeon]|nr:hypothetical protein [Nitrososphaerota archaeon]
IADLRENWWIEIDGHRSARRFIISSIYEAKSRKWMKERLLANGLAERQAQLILASVMYQVKRRTLARS